MPGAWGKDRRHPPVLSKFHKSMHNVVDILGVAGKLIWKLFLFLGAYRDLCDAAPAQRIVPPETSRAHNPVG